MSTSDAGGGTPSVSPPGRAVVSRLIATFSGTVGLGVKILLLGVMNALAVWAAASLVALLSAPSLRRALLAQRRFQLTSPGKNRE